MKETLEIQWQLHDTSFKSGFTEKIYNTILRRYDKASVFTEKRKRLVAEVN